MTTHDKSASREYQAWWRMKQSCTNPKASNYAQNGQKGIEFCPRWNDFLVFLKDMGPMKKGFNSLARIDKRFNYFKENCCWKFKSQGRPRTINLDSKKKPRVRQKVLDPINLCVTLEKNQLNTLKEISQSYTERETHVVSVNDVVRAAIQKYINACSLEKDL